jgi:hypothetical protein
MCWYETLTDWRLKKRALLWICCLSPHPLNGQHPSDQTALQQMVS